MKNKKYHIVGTVPKSDRKIVERGKMYSRYIHNYASDRTSYGAVYQWSLFGHLCKFSETYRHHAYHVGIKVALGCHSIFCNTEMYLQNLDKTNSWYPIF